jgi:hypothetical protein
MMLMKLLMASSNIFGLVFFDRKNSVLHFIHYKKLMKQVMLIDTN